MTPNEQSVIIVLFRQGNSIGKMALIMNVLPSKVETIVNKYFLNEKRNQRTNNTIHTA